MSNIIWIIVIGFDCRPDRALCVAGAEWAVRLYSHDCSRNRRRICCNLYWPAHRLVSTRSRRGSYRRDGWRSDRVVHLEQACGPPCYRRSGRGTAGPPAIVKPDAHECLNNMMAKALLLIIIELGAYRSKTWD